MTSKLPIYTDFPDLSICGLSSGIAQSLLSCYFFFMASIVHAAEPPDNQLIILSRDGSDPPANSSDQSPPAFIETDIVPLGGSEIGNANGTEHIIALTSESRQTLYRFSLSNASLIEILNALATTLNGNEITIQGQPSPKTTVVVKDQQVYVIHVTLAVHDALIDQTIDQLAVASGCNIFMDGEKIVVDLCHF